MDKRDLRSGVAFQETGELVLSNTFCIVPIKFDFEGIVNNLHRIREGLELTLTYVEPLKPDVLMQALAQDLEILIFDVKAKISKL